jgi:undecaprenyl diphosphate synthase
MTSFFDEKKEKCAKRLGIQPHQLPRHIAIIMDGNGRWATSRDLPRFHGHRQGAKIVESVALHASKIGIEMMTLYSFSMQNWKRPQEEIDYLMYLYAQYLVEIRPTLMEHQVRLIHLGSRYKLPDNVLEALDETVEKTSKNPGMVLGLALNYGARIEITEAIREIAQDCVDGKMKPDEIDPSTVSEHLYTKGLPDPDLLIRTSGELRISNFLLWQLSYAEFYVTDTYWPDFDNEKLEKAILAFSRRVRRFGDIESKASKTPK